MEKKVKITKDSTPKVSSEASKIFAWRMDPSPTCRVIENYDPKSKIGIKISLLMIDYERKCAQAKIDLIDGLKKLLNPPKKP
jgi:hypothetical protein